jgi:tetraacyldisaccharide 4'-kinase
VHAVAGIGHPARFFRELRAQGLEVIEHAFPDHHAFAAADLAFGDALPVLMTEKDAVKCADIAGPQHWYVPVRAVFSADEAAALLDIVMNSIQRRAMAV